MTTGLTHQLVREYLVRLDTALLSLPAAQAAELREQLTAHLDDALAPDAGDDEVRAVLAGLGEPRVVAPDGRGSWRHRIRRVKKRWWAALCVSVCALVGAIVVPQPWLNAAPLECTCAYGWADPVDGAHKVDTTADGHSQTTVRVRPNSTQGFFLQLVNRTDVTQTILGWGLEKSFDGRMQPEPGPFYATKFAIRFGPEGNGSEAMSPQGSTAQPPLSIRPGGFRVLSVTWQTASLPCLGPGVSAIIDSISLRVRVGWFTRNEELPLPEGFAITGPSQTCSPGS